MKLLTKQKCCFCGKTGKDTYYRHNLGAVYCGKHRTQMEKHGACFERTTRDSNEIVKIDKDTSAILLYDRQNNVIGKALIDSKFENVVSEHKWSENGTGHVKTALKIGKNKYTTLYLHNLIMNKFDKHAFVDHIDGDPKNNKLSNLRICSPAENTRNNKPIHSNTGYKGVYERYGKYTAVIGINGKGKILGRFNNIEDAVFARVEAEIEYYKDFSCISEDAYDIYLKRTCMNLKCPSWATNSIPKFYN